MEVGLAQTERKSPLTRVEAAPERPKVHDWKSCVRATVPRVRPGVETSTKWKFPRRDTVRASARRRRRRPVNPFLSAHDAYR
jgi:hypothetical protein